MHRTSLLSTHPFAMTFGVREAREINPFLPACHPDAWVTIMAPTYHEARVTAFAVFRQRWSDLHSMDTDDWKETNSKYYPAGELLTIRFDDAEIEDSLRHYQLYWVDHFRDVKPSPEFAQLLKAQYPDLYL